MRKFLRSIARARMKRKGLERINQPRGGNYEGHSYFARNWRKYVNTEPKN